MLSSFLRAQCKSSHQLRRASATAATELLQFIRSSAAKENPEQVFDVLKSGLSHQSGLDAGRLHVALAEVMLDKGDFIDAVSQAAEAAAIAAQYPPADALAQDLHAAGNEIGVRALLAQGEDSQALNLAQEGLQSAREIPEGEKLLSQRWRHLTNATARLGLVHLATHSHQAAQNSLQEASQLAENEDPAVGPLHGDKPDLSALPMMPRDMLIPSGLLSCGIFAFTQGNRALAARYLQRAAMAGEAGKAQTEAAGKLLLAPLTMQETILAAFSGHVQTELSPGTNQQGWKQAEVHLESALQRAEEISGAEHPRIIPTLINIGDVFSHTGRATLAEGLFRKAAKMLYREPSLDRTFVPRKGTLPVHSSLAMLLAWRYAQLLTALPKRGSEASQRRLHAEELATAAGWGPSLEEHLGDLESLKGGAAKPAGVFVHNALLRVLPCTRPFVNEVPDSDGEHEDAEAG